MSDCQIFISYRRNNATDFAGRLQQSLRPEYEAFYDFNNMTPGDFPEQLRQGVRNCKVFILVLSEGALDTRTCEKDWVREEIIEAVENEKVIIPIVFDGFEYPEGVELPEQFEKLKTSQNIYHHRDSYDNTVKKLIEYLNILANAGIINKAKDTSDFGQLLESGNTYIEAHKDYFKAEQKFLQATDMDNGDYRGWYGAARAHTQDFTNYEWQCVQKAQVYIDSALAVAGDKWEEVKAIWDRFLSDRSAYAKKLRNEQNEVHYRLKQKNDELVSLQSEKTALETKRRKLNKYSGYLKPKIFNSIFKMFLAILPLAFGSLFLFASVPSLDFKRPIDEILLIALKSAFGEYNGSFVEHMVYLALIFVPIIFSIFLFLTPVRTLSKHIKAKKLAKEVAALDAPLSDVNGRIMDANYSISAFNNRLSEIADELRKIGC